MQRKRCHYAIAASVALGASCQRCLPSDCATYGGVSISARIWTTCIPTWTCSLIWPGSTSITNLPNSPDRMEELGRFLLRLAFGFGKIDAAWSPRSDAHD
jgi:hypothetical protein